MMRDRYPGPMGAFEVGSLAAYNSSWEKTASEEPTERHPVGLLVAIAIIVAALVLMLVI